MSPTLNVYNVSVTNYLLRSLSVFSYCSFIHKVHVKLIENVSYFKCSIMSLLPGSISNDLLRSLSVLSSCVGLDKTVPFIHNVHVLFGSISNDFCISS